jgi:predicted ATPase
MKTAADRFFVLTGGPGSGKTTLVKALDQAGYAISTEAGRAIIQDQEAVGGRALPWRDVAAFAEMMLCWEMRSYRLAQVQAGAVFFDRGIPDVIGYLRLVGLPVPAHMERAAEVFRYSQKVLILPPWPEIYEQDRERRQTPEEAERTYEAMVMTYRGYGYELLTVPLGPVDERLEFVIKNIDLT